LSKEDELYITMMSELITVSKQAPVGKAILLECMKIASMLIQKNIAYGNSALNPIQIFAKTSPGDQLDVRIDDKLNRIKNGSSFADDNDTLDLVGYLVLKLIHQKARVDGGSNAEEEESNTQP
jgi:hypothetical protein